MTTTNFDQGKAEAFAGSMLGMLNQGSAALMTSIGHQTGLFDIMATLPASTSGQIAEAAGLNERYVREWLGAMVTSRIVDYDATAKTFRLPPEHAAFVTRAAGINNIAANMDFIPLMANVQPQIIECFHTGGGVPYAAFPQFQHVMAESSGKTHDAALIEVILPLVPAVIERLQAGITVADVGCGRGHAINVMARAFPHSHFTGYDFSTDAIEKARAEAAGMGLTNATFEVKDVATLDSRGLYDLITAFDSIHDQARPAQVLSHIANALRPAGVFLMVDIAAASELGDNLTSPFGTFGYTVSTMHCMTVSLALDGAGLGTMWGEQMARQMLHDAGFADVVVKKVDGDIFNNYYVATR